MYEANLYLIAPLLLIIATFKAIKEKRYLDVGINVTFIQILLFTFNKLSKEID